MCVKLLKYNNTKTVLTNKCSLKRETILRLIHHINYKACQGGAVLLSAEESLSNITFLLMMLNVIWVFDRKIIVKKGKKYLPQFLYKDEWNKKEREFRNV